VLRAAAARRILAGKPPAMEIHMPRDRVVEFAALALMAVLVSIVTYASILF
jgi:hypothetical protein